MLNKGSFFVVLVLFFLVALTSWYVASLTRLPSLPAGGSFNMGVLTQVNVIQTTDTGALQYKGSMQKATQLGNGDVNFERLSVTFYNGDNVSVPWTLTSNSGSALKENTEINLNGNINLSRPSTANSPPVLIQTDAATIYPDKQEVTGTGLITFSQPGTINQTRGVGFVANLQQKWIKLLSQVKSTYAGK